MFDTHQLLAMYEKAAGKAAVIELQLRILVEIVPELEGRAHDFPFKDEIIFDWFAQNGDPVSTEDIQLIGTSRTLRNKLLHGDLRLARQKMIELGAQAKSRGYVFNFEDDSVRPISEIKGTEAGIGSWLFEFAWTGGFDTATEMLGRTSALLSTLSERACSLMLRGRL